MTSTVARRRSTGQCCLPAASHALAAWPAHPNADSCTSSRWWWWQLERSCTRGHGRASAKLNLRSTVSSVSSGRSLQQIPRDGTHHPLPPSGSSRTPPLPHSHLLLSPSPFPLPSRSNPADSAPSSSSKHSQARWHGILETGEPFARRRPAAQLH